MVKTLEIILKEERESIALGIEERCPLSDIKTEIERFVGPCTCIFHQIASDIRKIKNPVHR